MIFIHFFKYTWFDGFTVTMCNLTHHGKHDSYNSRLSSWIPKRYRHNMHPCTMKDIRKYYRHRKSRCNPQTCYSITVHPIQYYTCPR